MLKRVGLVCIILIIAALLFGEERSPGWHPVIHTNSTVAYCHVTNGGEEAEDGDITAAFVGSQCRGVGNIIIINDLSYAVMNIQGEQVETVSFFLWDASSDIILDIEQTTMSNPGHDIGYPPNFVELNAIPGGAENYPPVLNLPLSIEFLNIDTFQFAIRDFISDPENDYLGVSWTGNDEIDITISEREWQVTNYGSFTSLYGYINQDGESVPLDYETGIFVGEECRGVGVLQSYNGRSFLNVTVQGVAIEQLMVKIRNPETKMVWVCPDLIDSNPGGTAGYPTFLEINCDLENLEEELLLSSSPDWIGSEEITFIVTDHVNEAVMQSVLVQVISGNHAPELALPESVEIDEDEVLSLDFSLYAGDIDGDELELAVLSEPAAIEVEIEGLQVSFSAEHNWNGTEDIEFVVSDPGGLEASDWLTVTFLAVNDAPVLNLPAEIVWDEDTEHVIDLGTMIYDAEGDQIEVEWQENSEIAIEESEINWEPVEYIETMLIYGVVSIAGSDFAPDDMIGAFVGNECRGIGYRWGATNFTTFHVYTAEVETMYFRILDVSENLVYGIDLEIETIPGGVIGYPPNFLPFQADTILNNLSYRFEPAMNWYGETSLALMADDGEGGIANGEISVIIAGVNDLPVLELPEEIAMNEGEIYLLNVADHVTDIDSDTLYVTAECENLELVVNGMLIEISAGLAGFGIFELEVSVIDGEDSVSGIIEVEVIDGNQAPEFDLPESISFAEDSELYFNWRELAADADGDEMAVLWIENEQIMITAFGDDELIFSAAADWNGSETIYLSVIDGIAVTTDSTIITVTAVNDAPVYLGAFELEFDEDNTFMLNAGASWLDVDGDVLEYSGTAAFMEINIENEILELIPDLDWNGSSELEFSAFDGEYLISVLIDINVLAVNDAPWLALPEELNFIEDESYEFDISDYSGDIDSDELEYGAQSEELNIEFMGSQVFITAPDNWNGAEQVSFWVSDEQTREQVMQEVLINVYAVNDAPQIDMPESVVFASGSSMEIDISQYGSDIDSEDISVEVTGNENIEVVIDGLQVLLSADINWQGEENLSFTLMDGELSDTDDMLVYVTSTGTEFELTLPEEFIINEDETGLLDLAEFLINISNDEVEIELTDLNHITTELNGLELSLTGMPEWHGNEELGVSITSMATGETVAGNVMIIVEAVNDSPVLALPDEITLGEDSTIFFNFYQYCSDIDDNQLFFSLNEGSSDLNIQLQGYNALISGIANYFGSSAVSFCLSDGEIEVCDTVMIVVTPVNDLPIINLPNRFYVYEDGFLIVDMSNYILEFDDDELELSVAGNVEISADINGMEITFSGSIDWSGSETISIHVDDGVTRTEVSDNVQVVVLAVNDAPLVELPEDLSYPEDGQLLIELSDYYIDVDSDELDLSVNSPDLILVVTGNQLQISSQADYYGESWFTLCVSDQEFTTCDTAYIEVTPVNDAPQFNLPLELTGNEDEDIFLDLADHCSDIDSDTLFFTAESEILIIDLNDSFLTISAAANWHGEGDVQLSVSDGELNDTGILQITFLPVNDPPEFDLPGELSWLEDEYYEIDLSEYTIDIDADELVYTGDSENIIIAITGSFAVLSAPVDWFGEEEINFTVSDDQGRSIATDNVFASVTAVNDAPVLNLPEDFILYEDTELEADFSEYCSDVDNIDLLLELNTIPANISVQIDEYLVSFSGADNWSGSEEIEFSLSDGNFEAIDNVIVSIIAVGDEPQLNLPNSIVFDEDNTYTGNFTSYIQNIEGYELELTSSDNANLTIEIEDYQVSIIPDPDWNGSEQVWFHLLNSEYDIDVSDSLMVVVNAVNDAPVLELPELVSGQEDDVIELDISQFGSDLEGDELTYGVSGADFYFSLSNDLLSIWLEADEYGSGELLITVSDTDISVQDTLAIIIEPVNDVPWLELPEGLSFAEDGSLQINLSDYSGDVDEDILSYISSSDDLSIIQTDELIELSAIDNWNGTALLTVSVSDGIIPEAVNDTITITVYPVNDPPELVLPDSIAFNEDESYQLDISDYASDIDGDEIELTMCRSDLILDADGLIVNISAPENWHGIVTLQICIDDGEIEVCDSVLVHVVPVNDDPVFDLPAALDFEEDSQLLVDISEYCSDVDGDELSLTAASEILILEWTELLLNVSAPLDWNGEAVIQLNISDSMGGMAEADLNMIIEPVNDYPVINLPVEFSFFEDEDLVINLSDYCSDIDGDELSYIINSEEIIPVLEDSLLTLSAAADWNGNEVIAVEVEDGIGVSSNDLTTIHVNSVNDAPSIDLPAQFSFMEDTELFIDFAAYCQDIDSDELTITMVTYSDNIFADISGLTVILSSAENWYGNEVISFKVNDEEFYAEDEVLIVVEDVVDAPVFALPVEFICAEDSFLVVDFYQYIDSDPELENFLEVMAPANLEISITGLVVEIIPNPDWFGEELLEFHLLNNEYGFDVISSVNMVIEPVNDAPWLELPEDLSFAEDSSLQINLSDYSGDIDDNILIYTADSDDLNIIQTGEIIELSASENWYGTAILALSVSDDLIREIVRDTISITIYPVNDAPELTLPDSISFNEDEFYQLDISEYASDIDGDELGLTTNYGDLILEADGLILDISAFADWYGIETLEICLYDGEIEVCDSLIVYVLPVNDAPELTLPDSISFNEDESYQLDISDYASDIDGDELELTAASEILILDWIGLLLNVSAPANWNGYAVIHISISDGSEGIAEADLNIVVEALNDYPVIDLPAEFSFYEDEELEINLSEYCSDIDGDELSYIINSEEIITVLEDSLLTLSADADWFGSEVIEIAVDDGQIRVESSDMTTIIVQAVNDAPVLTLPVELSWNEDEIYLLNLNDYCSDIDNDNLEYSAVSLEFDLNLNNSELEIIPAADWYGEGEVEITAGDGQLSDLGVILINILAVNDLPEFDLPAELIWEEDGSAQIDLADHCQDIDGDELSYSSYSETIEIIITGSEVVLSAPADWFGEEEISFAVNDAAGRVIVSASLNAIVTPVNDTPVMSLPEEVSFAEDKSTYINLTSYISDIDDDTLQLEIAEEPLNITIQLQGYVALLGALPDYNGSEDLIFSLSDSEFTIFDTITVIVTEVNDAPVINLPNRFYFDEDDVLQVNFEQYIEDYDGDDLSLSVNGEEQINCEIDELTVSFSAAANWNGSEMITFIVYDGQERAFDSDQVEVVVKEINDPPEVNLPAEISFNEDEEYLLQLAEYISDIDSPELTYLFSSEVLLWECETENFLFWAPDNYFGDCRLIIEVSDEEYTLSTEISVEVIPVNDAPQFNLPTELTGNEDENIYLDLADHCSDIDNDVLFFTAESEILFIDLNGSFLTISAAANWHGEGDVQLSVSDGELYDTGIIKISIQPVNDPPEFDLPEEFNWFEDEDYEIDLSEYTEDIDADELFYSGDSENIIISITGSFAVLSAPADWFGEEVINFTVSDNQGRSIVTDSVYASVTAVNDAPVLNLPEEFILYEDTELEADYSMYCSDVDNFDLLLELYTIPVNISVQIDEYLVSFSGADNWSGSEEIEFSLSDGNFEAIDNVIVSIIAVGDEPQLNLPNSIVFDEDDTYSGNFTSYIQNIEGYELDLTCSGNANLTIEIEDYLVSIIPDADWNGSEQVWFHLLNSEYDIDVSDSVMVVVNAVNDAPVLELPELVSGQEDDVIELDISQFGSDLEGDELTYGVSGADFYYSLSSDLLSIWLDEDEYGSGELLITVSDNDISVQDTLAIIIEPVNDAPWLELPEGLSFAEDGSLQINLSEYSGDVDEDILSYIASSDDLSIIQTGELIELSAIDNWNGTAILTVSVSDGIIAEAVNDTITITVYPVNDPPELVLPDSIAFNEDESYQLDISDYASDIDGDEIELTMCRSDLILDADGLIVNISAPENWHGSVTLQICIDDGEIEVCDSVLVDVLPVNDDPVFDLPAALDFEEDSQLLVDISEYCSDVDGDELSLTAASEILILEWTELLLNVSAPLDWNGEAVIQLNISDSMGGMAEADLNMIIEPVNDYPVINLPVEFSFFEDEDLVINLSDYCSDIDGDELSYIINSEEIIPVLEDSLLTLSAAADWNGSEVIAVVVDDGQIRVENSDLTTIVVQAVNDAPFIDLPVEISFMEDTELLLDFASYCQDIDSEELTISMVTYSDNIFADIAGLTVILSSAENWYGSEVILFRVNDEEFYAEDEVLIVVEDVVDAPVFELPEEFICAEDSFLVVDFNQYVDSDSELENVLEVITPANLEISILDLEVEIIPNPDWFGEELLEFHLLNNEYGFDVISSVNMIIEPVNDAPWLELPEDLSFAEDSSLQINLSDYSGDIDDDILTYSAGSDDLSIIQTGEIIELSASENWYGTAILAVNVNDDTIREIVRDTISIIIYPVNDAPELTLPDSIAFNEDDSYQLDISDYASDIDGDELSLTTYIGDLVLEADGLILDISAFADWYGMETLEICLNDGEIEVCDSLIVYVLPVNDAPELTLPDSISFNEDEFYQLDISDYASDIDGDELNLLAASDILILDWVGLLLNVSAPANWNGNAEIHISISDGAEGIAEADLNVAVEAVNDYPVIDLPAEFSFDEDGELEINLSDYCSDIDEDELSLTAASEILILDWVGLLLNLSAPANWNGYAVIHISISDGSEGIAEADLNIVVEAANDYPVIDLPAEFSFYEDEELEINLSEYCSDIDGDELSYIINSEDIITVLDDSLLTLSADADWFGSEMIDIAVDDGQIRVESSDMTTIIVQAVNDAPVLALPVGLSWNEDEIYLLELNNYCSDIDNDNLEYSAVSQEFELNLNDSELEIIPVADWYGEGEVEITAGDGQLSDLGVILIEVLAVNDLPEFDLPAELIWEEDGSGQIDLADHCQDIDGDELSYSSSSETIEIIITGSEVDLSAPADWFGEEEISFAVNDAAGRVIVTASLNAIVTPVNDAPVMSLPAEVSFAEDTSTYINLNSYLSDIDDETLQLEIAEEPLNITIQLQGYVALLGALPDYNGTEDVIFSLSDSEFTIFDTITVIVTEVNDAPVINLPNRFYFDEDDALQVNFEQYIEDNDGDELSLSVNGGEQIGCEIDELTVSFSATKNWNGSEMITFTIDDGQGRAIDSDQVEVVVNEINDPPEVSLPAEISFNEDEDYLLQLAEFVSDIDNPELTYQFSSEVLLWECETENFLFWAPANYFGDCSLTIEVSDEEYTLSTEIAVEVMPVNDAPQFNLPTELTGNEDENIYLDLADHCSDIDDDVLFFTAESEILFIDLNGSFLTISAAVNWHGEGEVELSVGDGELNDTGILQIIYLPVNDPPDFDLPEEFNWFEDEDYEIDLSEYTEDIDADELYYSSDSESIVISITGSFAVLSAPADWFGEEVISFTVSDGQGRSIATDSVYASVTGVNDAPVLNLPEEFILYEDTELEADFSTYCSDVDNFDLLLELNTMPVNVMVQIDEYLVSFSGADNWSGSEEVEFNLTDGEFDTTGSLVVNIIAVGDEPQLNLPAMITFNEDIIYNRNFAPYIQNIEGYELEIVAAGNENMTISIADYQVSFIPEQDWNGNETIWFHLINLENNIDVTDSLMVIVNPVNDAPELLLPELVTGQEDGVIEVDLSLYGNDIDNEILTYCLSNSDFPYNLTGSNLTFWLPVDENGSGTIMISVSDGLLTASGILNAEIASVNDVPWLELPEEMSFAEDSSLQINLSDYSGDVDEDILSYTIDSEELDIIQTGELIELSAIDNWNGTAILAVSISDGIIPEAVNDTITITVYPVNDPPELVLPDSITFNEDESYQLDISDYASDIDGDEIVLTMCRSDLFLDAEGLIVDISAPENWHGIVTLQICIDDGEIEVCDSVLVNVLPVNDDPVLDLPAALDFEEDSQLLVDISEYCSDVDGDELSLTATSEILILEWQELLLNISAPADWNGEAVIQLNISDSMGGFAEADLVISIEPVNDIPVINLPAEFSFDEDEELVINLSDYCSDIDGDELSYTINSEEIIVVLEDSLLTLSAAADWNGSEVIAVVVDDGQVRVENSDLTTIIVQAVNDAPVIDLPVEISFMEDTELLLDFALYCQDIDSEELTITMVTYSDNIFADIAGLAVILSSVENWSGSEEIEFSLSDQEISVTDTITVTVMGVIDEAELALPEMINTNEDVAISTSFSTYIIDQENLDYYLMCEGSEYLQVDIEQYNVVITPEANWFGAEELEFHLINDQYNIEVMDITLIEVSPVNDPPVFEMLPGYQFDEDTALEIDLSMYASDIDSENLSFSVEDSYPNLMISLNDTLVYITATANYNGTQNVEFILSDGEYEVSAITAIEVTPVNDPPQLNLPVSISFLEDMSYEIDLDLFTSDVDNDILIYTVEADTLIAQVTGSFLDLSAPENWNGSEVITIIVNDQRQRLSVSEELTVNVNAVNDPPWLELPSDLDLEQGESITLDISLYGGDIDSDTLEVIVESFDIETVIEGLMLTLIAPADWSGSCDITIGLSDGENITNDQIMVTVNSSLVSLSYDLVENWNWVSFNTLPEYADVDSVFAELEGVALQIKAQNISSTWYENWGWVGQLSELTAGKMYLLKLAGDYNNFTVTGDAANLQIPIPLTMDWNWIGHLPQEPVSLTELMSPLEPDALQIKTQNISSTWYENWGWVGQLIALEAGVGYKLKMAQPDTLLYPEQNQRISPTHSDISRDQWRTYTGFENNMSLLAGISIEGLVGSEIREAAFFDESAICHGVGKYIAELDLWYFTVAGDDENQMLTLKILTDENQEFSLEPQIEFSNNDILGEPESPLNFDLSITPETTDQIPCITSMGQSYPNPCLIRQNRANLNIPFYLSETGFTELMIYNCKGQLVRRLLAEKLQSGEYLINWDGRDGDFKTVPSGVYLSQLKFKDKIYNRKMILLR
jgi:large repetitive protein